jgi:ABC-type glycerol-3-phosphate transport system permease component
MTHRTLRSRNLGGQTVRITLIGALLAGTLFPLYFLVVTSFKSVVEFSENYFLPPLQGILWDNWLKVIPGVIQPAANSTSIVLWTAGLVLLVVTPAAYAFSWHRFPGKEQLFTSAIVIMMLPSVLTFVPQFILVKNMGLLDTQAAVILPFVAGNIGMGLFLLRTFFQALPLELIEAARIDGASEMQVLSRIILPLSIPSLVTVAVLVVVGAWNSFLWPLVTLPSEANRVASIAATYFGGDPQFGNNFPLLMAAYLVSSLPLILILGGLLRYFMAGATAGAVKG